jgi:GT2 family glycosyltransferase
MTDLSIIVVCYKGWERLASCLEALNSFSGRSFSFEVIVVDNNSGDDTIYKIEKRFPRFKFIFNTVNGGFANGCNLGGKNASGEYLLFLNPDTVASEDELEKLLISARQNPSCAILSCRQVNRNGKENIVSGDFPKLTNLTGFERALFGRRKSEDKSLKPVAAPRSPVDGSRMPVAGHQSPDIVYPDWISGSVVLISNVTFKDLNGFDEDFWMYYEDVDLCRRARNCGGEIALCRDIVIEHNHGGSSRINLETTSLTKTEVHISRHLYISKHKSGIEKALIQSFLVINNIISGGIMAILGLIFFFIPKVFVRTIIFLRLISYYTGSLCRVSWISPRSVNY